MNDAVPVVTIDGPSGSGKGTVSRVLAGRLGWHLLDSGALYRLIALKALEGGLALDGEAALAGVAAGLDVTFAEGRIDFEGRFYTLRDCELLPKGPREGGPPLMIGSVGPRMLRITMPHVDAWNAWFNYFGNTPEGYRANRDLVDAACADVGRDPATVERTVAVLLALEDRRVIRDFDRESCEPLRGTPEQVADVLRAYARSISATCSGEPRSGSHCSRSKSRITGRSSSARNTATVRSTVAGSRPTSAQAASTRSRLAR